MNIWQGKYHVKCLLKFDCPGRLAHGDVVETSISVYATKLRSSQLPTDTDGQSWLCRRRTGAAELVLIRHKDLFQAKEKRKSNSLSRLKGSLSRRSGHRRTRPCSDKSSAASIDHLARFSPTRNWESRLANRLPKFV
jgi:hypothetical protein